MAEKSEQDVKQEVEEVLREIDQQREAAQQQGLRFRARSEEELYRKVRGEESSSSPYIFAYAGTLWGTPGSHADLGIYMSNPDPVAYSPHFVSIFFGAANFLDDIGEGLSGRDQRWPYLSSGPFSIASGKLWNVFFFFNIPYVPRPTTGIGNAVLWGGNWIDKGRYYDRALFDVAVK